MGCEEIRADLDAYALGALTPTEAKAVEAHVAGCPDCQLHLDWANRVVGLLPLAVPLRTARPGLRQRVLAAAARGRSPEVTPWRRVPVLVPLAAALALASGSLGWSVWLQGRVQDLRSETAALQRQRQNLDAQRLEILATAAKLSAQVGTYEQMVNAQRAVLVALAAPDFGSVPLVSQGPAQGASGVYFWSRENEVGGLSSINLPPSPEGKVYFLWLLHEGKPRGGGSFQTIDGVSLQAVNYRELGLTGSVRLLGVSIEDVGNAPLAPTSELVMYPSPLPNIIR